MGALQFATQMFTVREYTKTAEELDETLGKIAEIGYPAVQLSAVGCMDGDEPEVSAEDARALLDKYGLQCIATHRSPQRLLDATDEEIAFHKALGCDYTAIGGIHGEQTPDAYRSFLERANPMIEKLRQAGISFGVHNHSKEFARPTPGGPSLMDLLIDEGPDQLTFELDLYWVQHAGVNPVRVLERCPGRCPVIHIKDKTVSLDDGPIMAPIGEGNLDWEHILPACRKAGVRWVAVEQDKCYRDPFDCLRSSFDFLTSRDW